MFYLFILIASCDILSKVINNKKIIKPLDSQDTNELIFTEFDKFVDVIKTSFKLGKNSLSEEVIKKLEKLEAKRSAEDKSYFNSTVKPQTSGILEKIYPLAKKMSQSISKPSTEVMDGFAFQIQKLLKLFEFPDDNGTNNDVVKTIRDLIYNYYSNLSSLKLAVRDYEIENYPEKALLDD